MIPTTTRRSPVYTGTGAGAVAYAFNFKVFADADVQVVATTAAGVISTLVQGVDYTIARNADQDNFPGGTVTTSLATGTQLVMIGSRAFAQTAQFPNGGGYNAVTLERALDSMEMQLQQLKEQLGRTVQLPATSVTSTLVPAVRASKSLVFDSAGNIAVDDSVSAAAASAAAAAADRALTLSYLQAYRATSYGALAADPLVDPNGNAPTTGDEYFNTTSNLLKRFNGATWQASDISTANLAASSGSSLVGFIQAGTGAVARTLQSRIRDMVSVKDFGATGNGVTDDTAAIQAALAAFDDVYLPPGTYIVTGITLATNKTLIGAGRFASILKLKANTAAHVISLTSVNEKTIGIYNLGVDGNRANQSGAGGHGIYLRYTGSQNFFFDVHNIQIIECKQNGLDVEGSGIYSVSNISVFGVNGIGVVWGANDSLVTNLDIGDTGLHGITFVGGSNRVDGVKTWFTGQIDRTTSGDGFYFDFNIASVFSNLWAQNVGRHGFYFYDASRSDNCVFVNLIADGNQTTRTVTTSGLVLGCVNCLIKNFRAGSSVGGADQFNVGISMLGASPNGNVVEGFISSAIATGLANYVAGTSTEFIVHPYRSDFPSSPFGYNGQRFDNQHLRIGQMQAWVDASSNWRFRADSTNPANANDGRISSYAVLRDVTANRPTGFGVLERGYMFFDITLAAAGKPIWWSGGAWVDATGAVV